MVATFALLVDLFLIEISVDEVAKRGENTAVTELLLVIEEAPDTEKAFVTEGAEISCRQRHTETRTWLVVEVSI